MAYGRRDGVSYLDGVQVKVSEKFRPPRKVVLPFSLSRNSLPQSLNAEYDFSTEARAVEQAERYRKDQEAKRQACVDKVAADIEQFTQSGAACNGSAVAGDASASSRRTSMSVVPSDSILLPAPAVDAREPANRKADQRFSLAEFENDTSSPFDYMELQTINDMEELNSVFQGMTAAAPPARNEDQAGLRRLAGEIAENAPPANGFFTEPSQVLHDAAHRSLRTSRSTSDLHSSGEKVSVHDRQCNTPPAQQPSGTSEKPPETTPPSETLVIRRSLTAEEEELLRSVADMGFPEDRAVRVIRLQGTDSKKVIEYLCQIQSLIDEGFDAADAEAALGSHQESYEQALKFLRMQQQFLALGFQKEQIATALHECQYDRDRALDSLLG